MQTRAFSRKCVFAALAAVLAVALYAGAAAAQPEPPDYPADKCVFLQPIPYDAPIDPNSDALIQDLVTQAGSTSYFRMNIGSWTMSVYHINGSSYQLEDVYLSEAWYPTGYWLRDVPFPTDQTLKVTNDTDANFSIIDPNYGMEYNLWAPLYDPVTYEVKRNASGFYEARNGGMVYANGSGSSPLGVGHRGCGIAHSVGLIYPGELAAGTVYHALPYSFSDPAADPCPPATHSDGGEFGELNYPDRLPESAVFRLKPSVWTDEAIENAVAPDSTPWNHTEKTLAYAMRDYGLYVTDNAGNHHVQANHWRVYGEDPYLSIPGCETENREGSGEVVKIWRHYEYFLNPDNFEALDRVSFPYPEGEQELDYDNDGIINSAETAWGYRDSTYYPEHTDPANGPLDWDGDGLTNAQECQLRNQFRYIPLNPFEVDTDGDGYTDYQEAFDWSADPTNPFHVPDPAWPGMPTGSNLALNKPAASTFGDASLALDGDESTFCGDGVTSGSITVDLAATCDVERVVLKWLYRKYYGVEYTVQISPDSSSWTTIYTETAGNGAIDDLYSGCTGTGRYLKIDITGAGSPWALYLHEIEVYGTAPPLPPEADFRGEPTCANPPVTVDFTDLSWWSPTSWDWSFGDGGSSAQQHPSHQYTTASLYTVSLTATNVYGSDTETKVDYINVTDNNCHVGAIDLADAGPPKYAVEATITVHDQSCQPLPAVTVDITWSGCVSGTDSGVTLANGQVVFVSPKNKDGGKFQCCVDSLSKDGYPYRSDLNHETCDAIYNPPGQAPAADFVGDPTSGPAPLTVSFTDLSTGNPTSWDWTFGDTGTSQQQNPSHEYTSAAQYTVSLTAANQFGQDTETKPDYITATEPGPPMAEFSGNPTQGPPPLTVYFTDLSSGSPTSWDWTFGDGGTSQAQHPSHDYTSINTYTVSLTVQNPQGQDTETKPGYITVSEQSCHVGAIDMFNAGPPNYKAGATITVHDEACAVLAGVTVEISWSGAVTGTDSGVTNDQGQVTFTSDRNKNGGTFTCTVTDLTKAGYPYQSGDNHETSDSITLP